MRLMYISRMVSLPFCLLAVSSSLALAQPDYGHDFVTVGAPFNRGTLPEERSETFDAWENCGSVGYEFQISRTEILTEDWYEFVVAYQPFRTGAPNDAMFTSSYIQRDSDGNYIFDQRHARIPVTISWENAARYCNWLHNGRENNAQAFEAGAYDTSTFQYEGGVFTHQRTASDGARYRLPSYDELVKAFYFDPNRYGAGEEGYWPYPQGGAAIPISGSPLAGGTTNTGYFGDIPEAGRYPTAASPWGLLDASGGAREFTETADPFNGSRLTLGSEQGLHPIFIELWDRIDSIHTYYSPLSSAGFRIVHTVPSTSTAWCIGWVFFFQRKRNRAC